MSKMFEIEISRPGGIGSATVMLPATPWELCDALDMARITDKRDIYTVEMLNCELPYLQNYIHESANLYELNRLAQRLSELDDWQLHCFEGMVKMDAEKGATAIPVERLINFTHSMTDCQIAYEAHDDASLGRFYVENGFPVIPENLPEILYDILDYESIGRKARMNEGGVFTSKGYVVQNGEIAQTYRGGGAVPLEKPAHTIMLEVCRGYFNDPAYDNDQSEFPLLPADDGILDRAIAQVDAASIEECSLRAVDCIVPKLTELISDSLYAADGDCYGAVNELARQLKNLSDSGRLVTYKAMMEAAPQDITLEEAIDLAGQTESFALLRGLDDASGYAERELRRMMAQEHDTGLERFVNLYGYGLFLMEKDQIAETAYGLLEPLDCRTVEQCLGRDTPVQGMEMK